MNKIKRTLGYSSLPAVPAALLMVCILVAPGGYTGQSVGRSDLDKTLGFESPPTGEMPGCWQGGPKGTIFADDKVVHGGRWSARSLDHRYNTQAWRMRIEDIMFATEMCATRRGYET